MISVENLLKAPDTDKAEKSSIMIVTLIAKSNGIGGGWLERKKKKGKW